MPIVDLEIVFERLSAVPIRHFDKGDIVLADGGTTGQLLFLAQGAVDVLKDDRHIARVTEPGAVFGDMAALRSRPHAADVIAVRSSSFFVVHDAVSFLKAEPVIALYVAAIQSGRLDAGNRHLVAARNQIAAKGQRHRMCVAALDQIGSALRETCPPTFDQASGLATAMRDSEPFRASHAFGPASGMSNAGIVDVLQTSDAVCAAVQELTKAIGASRASQLSYRFVVNRVWIPMINEAINCLHDGLAIPEDLDAVLALGTVPAMGPLELADRIGLDIVLDLLDVLYHATDDPRYLPSPLLRQLVASGYLGRKSGRGIYEYYRD
jgi:3-hydroxyacyl-CoA dehydrogenase, C-terminal domain/Cyclic nucleotide-binding domain